MKRGIVIGKFMPLHQGHVALIEFAARSCDELVVAIDGNPAGTIPANLRLRWLKETFQERKNIKIFLVRKSLPQDKEPSRRASRIWAEYLAGRFGRFDFVFSSELYGDFVAEYLGAKSWVFDLERKRFPVSGTKVREKPFRYWGYLPECVRPYFVKRICVFGPESCGKSTMAAWLARHYDTRFVPEYARAYAEQRGNRFAYADMDKFARGQERGVRRAARGADKLVFSDTDAITTLIYSHHYFGKASSLVQSYADAVRYDFYLFLDIDLPWMEDPLRDAPHLRREHREIFLGELEKRQLPYAIIRGQGEERFLSAVAAVDEFARKFQ